MKTQALFFIGAVVISAFSLYSCQNEIEPAPSLCETTEISFEEHIKPIILTNCAIEGCHDGSNGAERNWTVFSNVKSHAADIKARTQNGSMPRGDRSISQEDIDLIACWVDKGALNN